MIHSGSCPAQSHRERQSRTCACGRLCQARQRGHVDPAHPASGSRRAGQRAESQGGRLWPGALWLCAPRPGLQEECLTPASFSARLGMDVPSPYLTAHRRVQCGQARVLRDLHRGTRGLEGRAAPACLISTLPAHPRKWAGLVTERVSYTQTLWLCTRLGLSGRSAVGLQLPPAAPLGRKPRPPARLPACCGPGDPQGPPQPAGEAAKVRHLWVPTSRHRSAPTPPSRPAAILHRPSPPLALALGRRHCRRAREWRAPAGEDAEDSGLHLQPRPELHP